MLNLKGCQGTDDRVQNIIVNLCGCKGSNEKGLEQNILGLSRYWGQGSDQHIQPLGLSRYWGQGSEQNIQPLWLSREW
jgi:hypothetical protein